MKILRLCIPMLLLAHSLSVWAVYDIPSTYKGDWANAGRDGWISGGWLPPTATGTQNAVTDHSAAGDGVADDTSEINACIAAAAVGEECYLPNGTYKVTASINLKPGVIVRGESTTGVVINCTFSGSDNCMEETGSTGAATTIPGGASLGDTSITVASSTSFDVGDHILIRQHESDDSPSVGNDWDLSPRGEIVKITNIVSNTFTLERGLYHSYSSTNDASVTELNASEDIGIRDLTLTRVNSTSGRIINFTRVVDSWIYRVRTNTAYESHVLLKSCANITIGQSMFSEDHVHSGGQGYGVEVMDRTSDSLIYDSIFYRNRHSMIMQSGAAGNVWFANYSLQPEGDSATYVFGDAIPHGNYPTLTLYEHNIFERGSVDYVHGNNGPTTYFRNLITKHPANIPSNYWDNPDPFLWIENYSANNYIIGNEIGDATSPNSSDHIKVTATGAGAMEHGNYIKQNDTVYWDGGEADHDLPDSYFLSSRPAWWCSGDAWPEIGPETGLKNANAIPAKDRYDASTPFTFCTGGGTAEVTIEGAMIQGASKQ